MNTIKLPLKQIRYDNDDLQPRCDMDWTLVGEYAEAMKAGAVFPPVTVFSDGNSHWLADGFHRVHATRKAGVTEVEAEIREGDRRDAVLFAMGANASHGKRRTNEDKRRAVKLLLKDREWKDWSDREIARVCAVSNRFVSGLRKPSSVNDTQTRTFLRGGSEFEMTTANIGHAGPPSLGVHGEGPAPSDLSDVTAQSLPEPDLQRPAEGLTGQRSPQITRYGAIYADITEVSPDTRPPTPTDHAVLFLLSPSSTLRDALSLVDQWGFTYTDHAVVQLGATGMGTWFKPQHKLLLVGTRGDVKVPAFHIRESLLVDTIDVDVWVQNLIEDYAEGKKRLDMTGRITGIGHQSRQRWHGGVNAT